MFDKDGTELMIIGGGVSRSYGLMAAMAGLALSTGYNPFPYALRKLDKPYKSCLLHGCTNETNHNGGCCCAAHCTRHKIVTAKLKKHYIRKAGTKFIYDWNLVK